MHPQSTSPQLLLFEKCCTACGLVQPRLNFGAYTHNSDGLRTYCKSCAALRYQQWRAAHSGPCAHDGCSGRPYRRGLCASHYRSVGADEAEAPRWVASALDPLPSTVTPLDLAWMAGLFDGEGSIFISRMRPRNRAGNPHYEAGAFVAMTSEAMIHVFAQAFGGGVCAFKPKGLHHKPQWRWRVTQWRAVRFLRAIRSYLRLKGPQADLALSFMELNMGRHQGSSPLSANELAERAAIYEEMAVLNGSHWGRRRQGWRPAPLTIDAPK